MISTPDQERARDLLHKPYPRLLDRLRRRLFQALEMLVFLLVIAILVLVFTQVFTRYVLHVPVNWLEEGARMALVWLVMLGASLAAERREHYVIDMVVQRLPARIALVMLLLTNLLALTFLVILAVKGVAYFESSMSSFYVSLNVPRGYVYIAVPLGAAFMAFSLVAQSVEAWFTLTGALGANDSAQEPVVAPLPHE